MMSPESVTSAMPPNNECGEEEGWSGDNECDQDGKEVTKICEDRVEEPKEGMTFDTSEDAYLFYRRYAKENEFSVSKRISRKGSDGKLKDITLSCSRQSCWKGEGENKQPGQTTATIKNELSSSH
ncbi:hypothetical protein Acr_00g0101270 [Actinidia rufa]|uniref:FAR1 domain-containing protein n=1 Tax=Actinidia rufa TaxID=165716 RepID=A0A7J0E0Q2_9ERIC|nr:hypothetical protein Acr_00g0101270 [Actinidia rufa]